MNTHANPEIGARAFVFHYHPEFELVLTKGGTGRRLVGDNVSEYGPRDLVLTGPNLPHGWLADPYSKTSCPPEIIVLPFTRESIGLDFLEKDEMSGIRELLARTRRGISFSGPDADAVIAQMEKVVELSPIDRLIALLSILSRLSSCPDAVPLASKSYIPAKEHDHVALAKALALIHRDGANPPTLPEMAKALNMSVPTCCRFFKRVTGKGFIDHLNDWRISRACTLLAETDTPIQAICRQTGFHNVSHFNRQFRDRRGVSPRDFRRSGEFGITAGDTKNSNKTDRTFLR